MNKKNLSVAIVVALLVGSLLNLINSYQVIIHGKFSSGDLLKIAFTYITPFCVSLFSSVKAGNPKNVNSN